MTTLKEIVEYSQIKMVDLAFRKTYAEKKGEKLNPTTIARYLHGIDGMVDLYNFQHFNEEILCNEDFVIKILDSTFGEKKIFEYFNIAKSAKQTFRLLVASGWK